MCLFEERERVWKSVAGAGSSKDVIAVAANVFKLNDRDLKILADDLINKCRTLSPLEEWVIVFAKHAALERGKLIVEDLQADEEGSPYRLITERESRRSAAKKPAASL